MRALLIVDMQHDFMPGGALPVPEADRLVPIINRLLEKFPLVIATQDWHPKDHLSFAENHPGKKVGEIVKVEGIDQILWPIHCVAHTYGAELVEGLKKQSISNILHKGVDKKIDSYSTFFDNARRRSTGLQDYLHSRQVKEVYIAGVATDYCVFYSVLDALELGFKVYVILDACRGIDLNPGDVEKAIQLMRQKGAKILFSSDLIE